MNTKSLLAIAAAALLAVGLSGCGAAASNPIPTSTAAPITLFDREPGDVIEKPEPTPVVEIPLDESAAPVEEEAPAPAPAPAPVPAPQPAPAPAPAPVPDPPVLCPAGSSATASDGYNDTSCMRNNADNGGSCWEGDNGMLPECQPFRP